MFTWTSRPALWRAGVALLAAFSLSGCLELQAQDTGAGGTDTAQTGQRSFALASSVIVPSGVTAKGPPGFCIDKRSVKTGRTGGFALIAPCAALDARADGLGLETAILTLQVQPVGALGGDISAQALAEVFAAEEPIYLEDGDGISLVQLAAGGEAIIPQSDPKHWRGALKVNGYLVGLAVYAEVGGAAAGDVGKTLLIDFAEAVLSASTEPLSQ